MGASWQSTLAGGKLMAPHGYNRLTKQFIRVPNPYCYRCPLGLKRESCSLMCLTVLRTTVQRGVNGQVAGLIVEPLQASGGQVIFPREYLAGVRAICDELGIVLIYDEIQTFARIGTFFPRGILRRRTGHHRTRQGPGGGVPHRRHHHPRHPGRLFARDRGAAHLANNFVSQVAALKLIDELERWALANSRVMGERIGAGLRETQKDFPVIGDVRQAGLHIGVELVKDRETREPHPRACRCRAKKGPGEGDHLWPGRHGEKRAEDQAAGSSSRPRRRTRCWSSSEHPCRSARRARMSILSSERRRSILELVAKKRSVTVIELAELFPVSPITPRRDLDRLAEENLVERVHGGAMARSAIAVAPPASEQYRRLSNAQLAIGREAAARIRDGDYVILESGSTCSRSRPAPARPQEPAGHHCLTAVGLGARRAGGK